MIFLANILDLQDVTPSNHGVIWIRREKLYTIFLERLIEKVFV